MGMLDFVKEAGEKLFGIEGTPTFFFNGQKQVGELSIDDVDQIIAPMLK